MKTTKPVTFITGNQRKADYLAQFLNYPIQHQKLELDELQSLDLAVIVEHKVRQAFEQVKGPVLVEDVALEFDGLNGLPGTFIKFFEERFSYEDLCRLLDGKDRGATACCTYGYYDGETQKLFSGSLRGRIAKTPAGVKGYGFDPIFIPDGYKVTRAELSPDDDEKTYLQIKPLMQVKAWLGEHHG